MRAVLAVRDFRLLWLSQVGSTMADALVLVALALYVNRVGSAADVGLVLAAGTVTLVAFVLIGGVWADRLPRHRVMVVCDLIRGVLHGFLAVLILTGEPSVWLIALIEALFGVARAFFQPAYAGLVPQTVPDELITEAQAALAFSNTASETVGPALGALLVVTVGAGEAFAIDALTFFVSAALLLRVRARDRGGERTEPGTVLRELADGLREVRARPWIAWIIGWATLVLLVGVAPLQALGPAIADDAYGRDAIYGVLVAVMGAGTLAGTLLALRWRPAHPAFVAMCATVPWVLTMLAFALGTPLVLMLAAGFCAGAGFGLFDVLWESELVRQVPPAALSRVSSVDWMGSLALLPVGFVLCGPVAAGLGARTTLALGAALALAVTLAVLTRPALRRPLVAA